MAIMVNAVGNYALIYGQFGMPAMGLTGSAVATLITSVATLLAYCAVIRFDKRMRRYHLFGRWWRTEWSRFREIVRIGLPIGLIVLAEGGLFNAATFLMGLIGPAQLAGHALAFQVAALAFQVPFGVGQAATIRVGYHFGARDPAAIGRAGWAALLVGIGFSLFAAAAMLLFPRAILSAYVAVDAPANAAMVGFALQFILVAAAFHLFDAVQTVAGGALRGLAGYADADGPGPAGLLAGRLSRGGRPWLCHPAWRAGRVDRPCDRPDRRRRAAVVALASAGAAGAGGGVKPPVHSEGP